MRRALLVCLLIAGWNDSATADPVECLRQYGNGSAAAYSLAVDRASGDIAIAGALSGTVDLGGGPLTSAGDRDMFVAKFNSRCDHLWSNRFGTRKEEFFLDVRFDSAGNLILGANVRGGGDFGGGFLESAGDYDVFVVKLAPDGSHIWSKRFGDASYQRIDKIDVDRLGNVVIAGTFTGTLDFGLGAMTGRMYVAKLNASGQPVFSKAFSSLTNTDAQLRAIAVDRDGNIAVAGIFSGTIRFESNTLLERAGSASASWSACSRRTARTCGASHIRHSARISRSHRAEICISGRPFRKISRSHSGMWWCAVPPAS